jgi:hypothetical protein
VTKTSLSLILGALFLPVFQAKAIAPKVNPCNVAAQLPALQAAMQEALASVYEIEGETLDPSKVKVTKAAPVTICAEDEREDHDDGSVSSPCIRWGKLEAVKVDFVSPKGSSLSLRTASTEYGLDLDPALALESSVQNVMDREGNLTGKECVFNYAYLNHDYHYRHGLLIVNNKTGAVAEISKNLDKHGSAWVTPKQILTKKLRVSLR